MKAVNYEQSKANLLSRVTVTECGCWRFAGPHTESGYAQARGVPFQGAKPIATTAHRFIYQFLIGPIPEGLELDHVKERCVNRWCVNPAHLEPVTRAENRRRARKRCAEMVEQANALKAKGFTREQVASKLGVHYNTVYNARKEQAEVAA